MINFKVKYYLKIEIYLLNIKICKWDDHFVKFKYIF